MSTELPAQAEIESPDVAAAGTSSDDLFLLSQWRLMWRKFTEHKVAVAAGVFLVLVYLVAVFAPFFSPYGPTTRFSGSISAPPQRLHFVGPDGFSLRPFVYGTVREMDRSTLLWSYRTDYDQRYPVRLFVRGEPYSLFGGLIKSDIRLFGAPGGTVFLLGADPMGRDLLTRTIYGARLSLSIGLVGVALSFFLGLLLGGVAGYFGGVVDLIIQRISEILLSFPAIPLWMALSASFPPQWTVQRVYFFITIILSIIGWVGLGRQVRGKILSLKNEDFVIAARVCGARTGRLIRVHLVPSFISHIIAVITLTIPGMIIAETSLSFLGVGLRAPAISWGVLLRDAQNIHTLAFSPWLLFPGFCVIVTVLAFNFLGDGFRDAADPYS